MPSRAASAASLGGKTKNVAKEPVVTNDGLGHPFGQVLRDLLIEREITTGMLNPNWSAFAEMMPDVHYETLRKAVTGNRQPPPALMERCAAALGVEPSVFSEYRLWQAQRMFDPREVGLSQAEENLRLFTEARERKRR